MIHCGLTDSIMSFDSELQKRVMGNSCGGDRDGNPRETLGIDEITETVSTGDIVLYHTLHFVPHVQRVFTHSE